MYSIKVNNSADFKVDITSRSITINDTVVDADMIRIDASNYHIINKNKSYRVEVININRTDKTAVIKVNNNIYHIAAKDQFDALLDQLGLSNLNSSKISDIKAPMPGLVLKVFVSEGDEVQKGDNLFVLEAMKMENIIKAPADAVVKSIKVKPADKVEKGQLIILFK